jgi:hypothetical protein
MVALARQRVLCELCGQTADALGYRGRVEIVVGEVWRWCTPVRRSPRRAKPVWSCPARSPAPYLTPNQASVLAGQQANTTQLGKGWWTWIFALLPLLMKLMGGDLIGRLCRAPGNLADLGITKDQSARWQQLAKVPKAEVEATLAPTRPPITIFLSGSDRRCQWSLPAPEIGSQRPPALPHCARAGRRGEKRPADVIGNAVKVMRIATGEETEELPDSVKSTAAELGARGGKARAARMTPERRTEIARKAAKKRWQS